MTLHVGDPVLYKGERFIFKRFHSLIDLVVIEDDEGFAITVREDQVQPMGYTATVTAEGYVVSFEDTDG